MKVMKEFYEVIEKELAASLAQEEVLNQAVEAMSETVAAGGVIHVFGCGHSQMFGEELCFLYRWFGACECDYDPTV